MVFADSRFANFLRKVIPSRYRPFGYLQHTAMLRSSGRVMAGPFTSMQHVGQSAGSAMIPKILGIYERELASLVDAAVADQPDIIVDAGAAEGYYAVGFALRLPQARVIAFEMEPAARDLLAAMSRLNKVTDRVEIRGKCEPSDLQGAIEPARRPLVVCDVEGYEDKLLDPVAVPALCRASVIVETHDFVDRGITDRLARRFTATHRVQTIWQQERSGSEFPWKTLYTRCLPGRYLDWSVSEWRPERMRWLHMVPLDGR